MEKKEQQIKLNIRSDNAVLGGTYANNLMVHMTREEFVLDFINVVPPHATLNTRVILSPSHLKRMINIIKGTLERYEKQFGELPEAPAQQSPEEIVQ